MKKPTIYLIITALLAALSWWMLSAVCATCALFAALSKEKDSF